MLTHLYVQVAATAAAVAATAVAAQAAVDAQKAKVAFMKKDSSAKLAQARAAHRAATAAAEEVVAPRVHMYTCMYACALSYTRDTRTPTYTYFVHI